MPDWVFLPISLFLTYLLVSGIHEGATHFKWYCGEEMADRFRQDIADFTCELATFDEGSADGFD